MSTGFYRLGCVHDNFVDVSLQMTEYCILLTILEVDTLAKYLILIWVTFTLMSWIISSSMLI